MNDNLHQRLAQLSALDCQVAKRFNQRPVLLDTAADLLMEQWQRRQRGSPHNLRTLYLATPTVDGDLWVRPLAEVLVERYCQGETLNLTAQADFVTATPQPDQAAQVDIDLHALEVLINETGPVLLEAYRENLTAFWSEFNASGETPWQWYATFLRGQLDTSIRASTHLPSAAQAAAKMVHDYPSAAERSTWPNTQGLSVARLSIDFSADGELDVDLTSALLIERSEEGPSPQVVMVFTLTGRLLSFTSREAMLAALTRSWPEDAVASPRQVNIEPLAEDVFETMAGGVLDQQLHLIEQISASYRSRAQAVALGLDLDRLSSMIEQCDKNEASRREPLSQQLPEWLRNASSQSLMRYSNLLIDVAQGYHDSDGRFWLDDVDTAEAFVNRQLAARFSVDHQSSTPAPETVEVVNYVVTAAALPGAEGAVVSGEVEPVTYSLAQLAIANIGLLKPGRVELRSTTDTPLPDWLNETYIRRLVSELDAATRYPAMLRAKLLDAKDERTVRERLLAEQLQSQLPALAMELHMRGKLDDGDAARRISELFTADAGQREQRWVMRALGFIKAPGADIDHPRNTWLIEAQHPGAGPVLLYRPLHEDSLLSFRDRLALFVAISTPGDLQADILERLPAEDRRFYNHGGFQEPHLFVPLDDTSAIPFGTDAESDPVQNRLTMINLLLNIAMLLFTHSMFRLQLEHGEVIEPALPATPNVPVPALTVSTTDSMTHLDFSWTSAGQQLGAVHRAALDALQASVKAEVLSSPIEVGNLRGLYLYGASAYTLLDGKVFEVALDRTQDKARIVGPDKSLGPWLRMDEAGRWQLDLHLRLRGGQPLSSRLRKLALDKNAAMETVNGQLKAEKELMDAKHKEMQTIDNLVGASSDDATLQRLQTKMQAISVFWNTHLEHLKQRNQLQPVKDFKQVHAYALYQDGYCQRTLHKILHERYRPQREQLLEIGRQQQRGVELTASDVRIVKERLDNIAPLLDDMLANNTVLQQIRDELGKLASTQQADIKRWHELSATTPASPTKDLVLRFLRLEGMLNRVTLVHGISDEAVPWRKRFWGSIEMAIAQRARLYKLTDADEEVSARLLRSIREQFKAGERQLAVLASLLPAEAAQATLLQMKTEVEWLSGQTEHDLAELPDYPPTCTLTQLRSKVPGLIETSDHGLLLAEPRADDANTVDVPGPDNKSASRTYHLKHGSWVEVQTAKPAQPAAPHASLKHLLKGSTTLLANANAELGKLRKNITRYLPVELEESLQHHRDLLGARANAIEARLTADNETDEAAQGLDAEGVARSLRELSATLQTQATELRIEAALKQAPRMGEVQFLLEHKQVQIQPDRMRVLLAKVAGRPADFIDEYSISHNGQVLWYAHFHYPAQNTAREGFTEGHLKTAEQRLIKGPEVYYYGITHAAAQKVFFNL